MLRSWPDFSRPPRCHSQLLGRFVWLLVPIGAIALPSCAGSTVRIVGFELVHNAPVETTLATPDIRDPVTVWCEMIAHAKRSIDFEQFYVAGKAGGPLDLVLEALEAAGKRGVAIRFLMERKGLSASDPTTLKRLQAVPGLTFRLLDFDKISGDGIIHAKFFVVDGRTAYVGSQNFDWRSLEHIDETGLSIDRRRIVAQLGAIFSQDWSAQKQTARGEAIHPLRMGDDVSDEQNDAFLLASPNDFDPAGVGDPEAELPRLMREARREIAIEVMEYAPLDRKGRPYPVIDDAVRQAASRGVRVRLLLADWDLTARKLPALLSLARVPNVTIGVATIPRASAGPIPYARVVHTKTMVVDARTAWVGTSNWEGGYLDRSRNVEIVLRNRRMAGRLLALQDQLWNSSYAVPLDVAVHARSAANQAEGEVP